MQPDGNCGWGGNIGGTAIARTRHRGEKVKKVAGGPCAEDATIQCGDPERLEGGESAEGEADNILGNSRKS